MNFVLIVRLEEVIKHLRLAAKEAKELSLTDIETQTMKLVHIVEELKLPLTVKHCLFDPSTCNGCIDAACFH